MTPPYFLLLTGRSKNLKNDSINPILYSLVAFSENPDIASQFVMTQKNQQQD